MSGDRALDLDTITVDERTEMYRGRIIELEAAFGVLLSRLSRPAMLGHGLPTCHSCTIREEEYDGYVKLWFDRSKSPGIRIGELSLPEPVRELQL